MDGTITLVTKSGCGDFANVYWPSYGKWGSAEARDATPEEIRMGTQRALKILEDEQ